MKLFTNPKQTVLTVVSVTLAILAVLIALSFSDVLKTNKPVTKTEPVIELTTDKVILTVGDKFNAKDYIKTAKNSHGEDISQGIKSPELDTSQAGTYEITFDYKEGDTVIKSKTLKVIVANKKADTSATEGDNDGN